MGARSSWQARWDHCRTARRPGRTVETDEPLEPETSGSHEDCDPAAQAEAECDDALASAFAQGLHGGYHVVLHLRAGERGVVAVPLNRECGRPASVRT
jgi:hypothetical protein